MLIIFDYVADTLTAWEISQVADVLKPVDFDNGQIIVQEGEKGDSFYFIEKGSVLIKKKAQKEVVDILHENSFFGELSLMFGNPRAATVVARGDLRCLMLDKDSFTRVLGPIADILRRDEKNYNAMMSKNI